MNEYTNFIPRRIKEFCNEHKEFEVIATQYINYIDSPFTSISNWCQMYENEEQEIALCDDVKELPSRIFKKSSSSCFTSEFIKFIKDNNIKELYFAGVDSNCCVLSSIFSAFDFGIKPYFIKDLCASSCDTEINNYTVDNIKLCVGENYIL